MDEKKALQSLRKAVSSLSEAIDETYEGRREELTSIARRQTVAQRALQPDRVKDEKRDTQ